MKFSLKRERQIHSVDVNPDSQSSIEYAVDTLMEHMLKKGYAYSRTDPSRSNWLRISSLPFCARSWWLNQVYSRSPIRKEESTTLFFTRVGTAVHEAFQDAFTELSGVPFMEPDEENKKLLLPHTAVVVQDWVCKTCRMVHEFQPKPKKCSHCGHNNFGYKEHQVRYSRKVLGHMDGCFAFPHKKGAPYSKKWIHIPIDYKTASESVLEGGKIPYRGNVAQLLTYGAIKKREGYNIPGICLIYVRRDNPFKRKVCWVALDADRHLKRVDKWEQHYLMANEVCDKKGAMGLPRRNTTDYDNECPYCEYKGLCKAEDEGNTRPLANQVQVVLNFMKRPKPHAFPSRN